MYRFIVQYWSLLNWRNLRLHCGCVAAPVNWFVDFVSTCFAKFKNVVHSLEPGETPSTLYIVWSLVRRRVTRRLTRLQTMHNVLGVSPGSKLCTTFLDIAKHFKTVAVRLQLLFQFTYVQYCTLVLKAYSFHCKMFACLKRRYGLKYMYPKVSIKNNSQRPTYITDSGMWFNSLIFIHSDHSSTSKSRSLHFFSLSIYDTFYFELT